MATFGFELEAVALDLDRSFPGIPQDHKSIFASIAQRIEEDAGVRCAVYDDLGSQPIKYDTWNITRDTSISPATPTSESFHANVDEYGDVDQVPNRQAFELISPVFTFDYEKIDNDEAEKWKNQIVAVLGVLNSGLSWKSNSSCGLHIHIKSIPSYTLEGVKKIGKICILYEGVIDTIHQPDRGFGRNPDSENVFIRSNRKNPLLGHLDIVYLNGLILAMIFKVLQPFSITMAYTDQKVWQSLVATALIS